jgi:hypothetical protein
MKEIVLSLIEGVMITQTEAVLEKVGPVLYPELQSARLQTIDESIELLRIKR